MPLIRTDHVIDEGLQAEIRTAYQELTDSLNLVPRWGQRQMIAEVANALADPEAETPIAVVEAGTGTGKTIAYLVAALPIARARGKKLVVASATVALQEQLLFRDLPDVMQHSGLNFDAALAKGRGRYVCLLKLDHQLSDHGADPLQYGDVRRREWLHAPELERLLEPGRLPSDSTGHRQLGRFDACTRREGICLDRKARLRVLHLAHHCEAARWIALHVQSQRRRRRAEKVRYVHGEAWNRSSTLP